MKVYMKIIEDIRKTIGIQSKRRVMGYSRLQVNRNATRASPSPNKVELQLQLQLRLPLPLPLPLLLLLLPRAPWRYWRISLEGSPLHMERAVLSEHRSMNSHTLTGLLPLDYYRSTKLRSLDDYHVEREPARRRARARRRSRERPRPPPRRRGAAHSGDTVLSTRLLARDY